jgi:hypothetical protein
MKRTPLKRSQKPLKKGNSQLQRSSTLKKGSFNKRTPEEKQEMRELFLKIWDERQDDNGYCYCFETGKALSRSTYREISACYDHVLEKELYSQYTLVRKNIIIVSPEAHHQKGMNMDFTPKIRAYREELLNLHKQNSLQDE